MNWTLPSWATTEMMVKVKRIGQAGFHVFLPNKKSYSLVGGMYKKTNKQMTFYTCLKKIKISYKIFQRSYIGTLLKEIVENMNNKTTFGKTDEKKINLYTTVWPMLVRVVILYL